MKSETKVSEVTRFMVSNGRLYETKERAIYEQRVIDLAQWFYDLSEDEFTLDVAEFMSRTLLDNKVTVIALLGGSGEAEDKTT